ncbi:MAG: energy transducer TonB [Candidatus Acidiferrum sp.]|jgi:hypothetical protein
MFSSYASVCFNQDGTVSQILAEPIGLAFSDYYPFDNRLIARQLEVWPGARADIIAEISVLEPLERAQHAATGEQASDVFDVPQDTGFASRLRFVQLPDSALVPVDSPARTPLAWPSSFTFPVDGVIAIQVQIDRTGNIRELLSSISKNQRINHGAVEQIKNWKFQTFRVDGSPVQVSATLEVPFHLKYEPLGANGKEFPPISFGAHMKQSRALSDLRAAGSVPFRLRASFKLSEGQAGKYEETWRSPDEWQRQVLLDGAVLHQSRAGGTASTQLHGDTRNKTQLLATLSALSDRFPDLRTFQEGDWGNSAVPATNIYPIAPADPSEPVLIRAARGAVDANNHPADGQAYWFDAEGLLRANFTDGSTIVNSNFALWRQFQVPHKVELFQGTTPLAVLTVDSIDPL